MSLDEYGGTGIDDCLEAGNGEDQRSTNPINKGEERQSESQLEEEIALQETILESLQIRLHSLDKDIDRYVQGIDLSTQVIEDAQSKESQLIKKKNEHMMILKKVKQNYERCILALKKKLDMKPDCVAEEVSVQEEVIREEEAIEDIQPLQENDEDEEQIIVNPMLQLSVEITDPFDDEYMKRRWNQSAPSKMPVFQLQNTKLPLLMMASIPLHAPIRSKEKLSDMIRIMHSEIRARRKNISSQIELETDYDFFIKGTVLDFYAMSLYNPFVFEKLQSDCPMAKTIWDPNSVVEEEGEKETSVEERVIDPHIVICRDGLFGNCDDIDCPFQHIGNQMKKKSDWGKLEKIEKRKLNYVNLPIQAFPIPSPGSNSDDCSVDLIGSLDEKKGLKREFILDQDLKDSEIIDRKRPKYNMDSSSLTDKDVQCEQVHETGKDAHKEATFLIDLESGNESSIEGNNTTKENEVIDDGTSTVEELDDITGNEDFVLLPPIDVQEDTHDIASHIEIALEQCDINESECSEDFKSEQSPFTRMTTVSDALKNLGFQLSEDNYVSYTKELEHITNIDWLDGHIYFLKLTSNVISASKMCVHACRVDIANAILKLYKIFIESRKDTDRSETQILFGKIHLSLTSFVEESTVGRGSSSPNIIFHIQLYFSTILRVLNGLIEEEIDLALSTEDEYEYVAVSSANSVAITQYIDLYTEIFTGEYKMEERNLKSILLEVKFIQPLSANLDFKHISLRQQNSILLGNLLSKAVSDESFQLEDPQLIVENILAKLCSILKTFSFKSHQIATSVDRETKKYLQFEVFALFGPAIITAYSCIAVALLSENIGTRKSRRIPSPRTESILTQLKNYGMESIHYLDFSGVTRGNLCGQSLLAPYFAILGTVLVATRSYSKAHVLLTTALLPKYEEYNWMIYSDLLWSSLIQLHINFPHKNAHVWRYRNSLLGPLTSYGIHLSMITVAGDGYLSNCFRLKGQLGKTNKMRGNKKQKKKDHEAIEKNCLLVGSDDYMNVENIDCRFGMKLINHPPRPYPSDQMPLSLFLFSKCLSVLEFSGASMKYLPETFGLYFPNLTVSLKTL